MIVKVSYSLYVEREFLDEMMARHGYFGVDQRDLLRKLARRKGTEFLATIPGHIELLKTNEEPDYRPSKGETS